MKHLSILLFFSTLLSGVTATPDTVTLTMRAGSGISSFYSTRVPIVTTITISGTGDWNISRGGTLSTACSSSYCFSAATSSTASGPASLPTGNGPGTIYLYWRGLGADALSAGSRTGTLTVGSTVINITMDAVTRRPFDTFIYPTNYPSGCSNTNSAYSHLDTCTVTNERPTSTAFSIPSPGGSYVDPQFGHTIKRVTASGQNVEYGALSAFSATGLYVLTTSSVGGAVNVYTQSGTLTYSSVPGALASTAAWDATDDERLWFLEGPSIKYRQLNTSTTTTAATYSSASGPRPAMANITMGGTSDVTDDNWWVFRDADSFNTVCAVNLNGLTTGNQESKTFCGDLTSLSITDFDFPQITQVDSDTQKRYVVTMTAPATHVFSVGPTTLSYEYMFPTNTIDEVSVTPHSDVGQDSEGRQIFFWSWYTAYDNRYYLSAAYLNKGTSLTRPVEESGGGLRILYVSDPNNFTTGEHFGCNWRGVCVSSYYGNSAGLTAHRVSAVTPGTPCALTTATAHGYSSGTSKLIGGALGITSINGVFTITQTGSNTLTLDGHTCSGTYTANSAHIVDNVSSASSSPNRQEIVRVRPGEKVWRGAIHRAKTYNGGDLSSYWNSPRASISRDGRYIAFAGSFGIPEHPSVWVADLGVPEVTSSKSGGVAKIGGVGRTQ